MEKLLMVPEEATEHNIVATIVIIMDKSYKVK